MPARSEDFELAQHAARYPLSLVFPTARLREKLRGGVSESSTRDAPEGRLADDDAVLAARGASGQRQLGGFVAPRRGGSAMARTGGEFTPGHGLRSAFGAPPPGSTSQQPVPTLARLSRNGGALLPGLGVDLGGASLLILLPQSSLGRRRCPRLRPRRLSVPVRVASLLIRQDTRSGNPHGVRSHQLVVSLDGLSDSEGNPVVLDRSLSQLVGLSISRNVHFSEQETIASHQSPRTTVPHCPGWR